MSIELSDTQLHGYRSQDLKLQTKIDQETLLAVHQGQLSRHSSYGAVSSDVKLSALAMMHVGSMAFEETWEYSPSAHSHGNYTNVSVDTRYGSSGDGTTVKIGTLSVSNACVEGFKPGQYRTIDIYCPVVQAPVPQEPAYGTLRFMYSTADVPTINDAYIASDKFDGWVFPDGSSYQVVAAQFTKAGNKLVTWDSNPFVSGRTLRVPDLRNRFFKLNPFAQQEAAGGAKKCKFEAVASHSAVPSHTHPITSLRASVQLTSDMSQSRFRAANSAMSFHKEFIHHGDGEEIDGSPRTYHAQINFGSAQIKLTTTDAAQSPVKNYPAHWAMPVMIYVGGRKYLPTVSI